MTHGGCGVDNLKICEITRLQFPAIVYNIIGTNNKTKIKEVGRMAKRVNEVKEVRIIMVKDLAEEFDLTPSVIRRILRAAGLRAPQIPDNEGRFGPRAKYEWQEGSEELKQVRKILGEYVESSEEGEEAEEAEVVEEAEDEAEDEEKEE